MSTTTWLDLEAAKLSPPDDRRERMKTYLANASRLPPLDLRQHAGKWIALRWDGLAVLAADKNPVRLDEELTAHAIDRECVLFKYVPYEGEWMIEHGSEIEVVCASGSQESAK